MHDFIIRQFLPTVEFSRSQPSSYELNHMIFEQTVFANHTENVLNIKFGTGNKQNHSLHSSYNVILAKGASSILRKLSVENSKVDTDEKSSPERLTHNVWI